MAATRGTGSKKKAQSEEVATTVVTVPEVVAA